MSDQERPPHDATVRRLERGVGALTTSATRRMEVDYAWYRALPPRERTWVGEIARAGITEFVRWYARPTGQVDLAHDIFGAAPRALTRAITLQQTLNLLRTVVDVVDEQASLHAAPGAQQSVREAVLRFSREVAFAAAEIYALAAESRGAWDARLEALVVDAVLRGDRAGLNSRAAALGWTDVDRVTVVVGSATAAPVEAALDDVRRRARSHGANALVGMSGEHVIVILAGVDNPVDTAADLAEVLGSGAVVVGPVVDRVELAPTSAAAALSGWRAVRARPEAPRPVTADDLLPERVLAGDPLARSELLRRGYRPLAGRTTRALLLSTLAYLVAGSSVEAAARTLFVHPNTVRYRLRRVHDLTGWDPLDPRDGYVLRTALTLGMLEPPPAAE